MGLNPDLGGQQEVLTQNEVERLLVQVAEPEASVTVDKADSAVELRHKDSIQPYDFRHPIFLSASELRKLRLRHEEFLRALAARLSIYLRLELSLQMSKLQTVSFQKFTEGLTSPTHLTLFKVEPLRGICILEIHPRLGLTIVDRLMGGPAHSVSHDHDLSEIEVALLDRAVHVILAEWGNHWSVNQELRPVLLGHETNGRFLHTAAHDTVMLTLCIETTLGDCHEQMQIGFPFYTLEPLMRQCNQALEASTQEVAPAPAARPKWNQVLEQVRIPVVAEWHGLELTVNELARLQVGDVLQLDPACTQQVQVRLASLPKFAGRLGTQGDKWAVELTEMLKR